MMENHLESHSVDETDECTTEEHQTKDGKVDQVSLPDALDTSFVFVHS